MRCPSRASTLSLSWPNSRKLCWITSPIPHPCQASQRELFNSSRPLLNSSPFAPANIERWVFPVMEQSFSRKAAVCSTWALFHPKMCDTPLGWGSQGASLVPTRSCHFGQLHGALWMGGVTLLRSAARAISAAPWDNVGIVLLWNRQQAYWGLYQDERRGESGEEELCMLWDFIYLRHDLCNAWDGMD